MQVLEQIGQKRINKIFNTEVLTAFKNKQTALAYAMDGKHKGERKIVNVLTRSIEWLDSDGKFTWYDLHHITEDYIYYFKERANELN